MSQHSSTKGSGGKNRLLRASDSVKRQLVASIEVLDTRSMRIQTSLSSLPATAGSHVQRAVFSRAPRMRRHISSRARIGLRGGERVGIGTVSTTVARFFNGNARSSSRVKVLVGHQAASLAIAFTRSCGRVYLLRSSASRVLLRTKTGPRARPVCEDPSNPHGRATSETAAKGTGVECAFGASRALKKVPTRPPSIE